MERPIRKEIDVSIPLAKIISDNHKLLDKLADM